MQKIDRSRSVHKLLVIGRDTHVELQGDQSQAGGDQALAEEGAPDPESEEVDETLKEETFVGANQD